MRNIMKKNNFICVVVLGAFFSLAGCASSKPVASPIDSCPNVAQEPVSSCRAEQRCKSNNTRYGVGLGVGPDAVLGEDVKRTYATDLFLSCVEQNLEDQKNENSIQKPEIRNYIQTKEGDL